MGIELDREETPPALWAALDVACADEDTELGARAALKWLLAVWGAGHDHVPLSAIFDVGHLFLRGRALRFASGRHAGSWSDDERAARRAWEDRVLSRWALDDRVMAVHVAIAGMPAAIRDDALAHAITLALARTLLPADLPRANLPAARSLLGDDDRVGDRATLRERVEDDWRTHALEVLERMTAALAATRPFDDADVWEIAHFEDLPTESMRAALREVNDAAARLGAAAPGVLTMSARPKDVLLDDTQADTYPTGGFDAVSTKGAFENLVRSEVAYVGERIDAAHKLDMFDLRFVESELLYYTRDESPLLEARRNVAFIVERPDDLRHKLPALPAQTLVMILGLIVRAQQDLVQALGAQGSATSIILRGGSNLVIDEELGVMELLLRAEIAHRRVTLQTPEAELGRALRVVFSAGLPPDPARDRQRARTIWVRVGAEQWSVTMPHAKEPFVVPAKDARALRALTDRILGAT